MWPLSLLLGEHISLRAIRYIDKMVPAGYAVIVVDTRGTGASYGTRNIDLNEREQKDFAEMVEWVRLQSWCNGKIGTAGVSYDGMAAGIAASHGNVQAAALLFTPIDVYEETLVPGGVLNYQFLQAYAKIVKQFESNS